MDNTASPLSQADYYVPRDLQVTSIKFDNILAVGTCAAGIWAIKTASPETNIDYILVNNVEVPPEQPPRDISDYSFQITQLSLRHVLTDRIINISNFLSEEENAAIEHDALTNLEVFLDTCLSYNKKFGLLSFVLNFPVPQKSAAISLSDIGTSLDLARLIQKLNDRLAVLVQKYKNVYISDYNSIGNTIGKKYFSNDVMFFYSHNAFWHNGMRDFDISPAYNAPQGGRIDNLPQITDSYPSHLKEMLDTLWRSWEGTYRTVNQIDQVKLVIFDLDDTFWRGQIAEHYGDQGEWPIPDGWPSGVWEAVHHLRARGIMVAICSKNEETIVRDRWERAVMNNWVALDDFLFKEINWRPKAENIAKIIKLASLTPKSVLFIDDNPVERESVREALPGIRVIGDNPFVLRRVLLWSPETQVARLTQESRNRESMMRGQIEREADRASVSREEFLLKLDCRVEIAAFNNSSSPQYPRSIELLNKTNQFNTTGKRWGVNELEAFFDAGGKIYSFSVQDKYTAYGLVGVILYKMGEFTQFAMSCRVLGLEVETSVISLILQENAADKQFTARVVETQENIVCRDVFTRSGFVPAGGGLFKCAGPDNARGVSSHLRILSADTEAARAFA